MAKIFISYSRKDIDFAKRLTGELQKSELDFWIDWEGIPPTVDWWKEIEKGIEEADAFVFLISPDFANSKVCGQEIDHAVQNGKRLVPLIIRETKGNEVHPKLSPLNWIFFRKENDFDASITKLLTAIHTDYDWVQTQRRLQVKALEWERNNKENSFLLRGKDLEGAELQLTTNSSKEPFPTELQRQYVFESRREETRRRSLTLIFAGVAIVVLIWLSVFAFIQRNTAIANENTRATAQAEANLQKIDAQNQSRIALARQLAAQSEQIINSDIDLGILLAIQANKIVDLPETRFALINAIEYEPTKDEVINLEGIDPKEVVDHKMQISPDGKFLVATVNYSDKTNPDFGCSKTDILIIDTFSRKITSRNTVTFFATVHDINPTGDIVGLEIKECGSGSDERKIGLWSVSKQALIKRINYFAWDLIFLNDGKTFITAGQDAKIVVWDINTGQSIRTFEGNDSSVSVITTDVDEKMLISGSDNGKILTWNIETGQLIGEPIFVSEQNEASNDSINSIVITPDKRYILASAIGQGGGSIGRFVIWDIQSNTKVRTGVAGTVLVDLHSQDIVGSYELSSNTIKLLNIVTGETVREIKGYVSVLSLLGGTLTASQDGKWLYGIEYNRVVFWNLDKKSQTGYPLLKIDATPLIAVKDDGKSLALSGGDRIALYNLETGEIDKVIKANPNQSDTTFLAFQPNHSVLAQIEYLGATLKFWNTESGLLINLLDKNFNADELAFSADGKLLAFVKDDKQTVNIIDLDTKGVKTFKLKERSDIFYKMMFSLNNKYLVMGGLSKNIYAWDLQKEQLKTIPVAAINVATQPIINPNSNDVAIVNLPGNRIDVYDIENENVTKSFVIPKSELPIQSVYSSDGKKIAIAVCMNSLDGECTNPHAYIFDVNSAKPEAKLPLRAFNIEFSDDGNIIFASGDNGVVYGWNYNIDLWQKLGCHLANRNFTLEEWNTYIGTILPYSDTCMVNEFKNNEYKNNLPPILLKSPIVIQNINDPNISNSSDAGEWSASSTLPKELSESFSAIVQCRASADSDTKINEVLALWAISMPNSQIWIEGSRGEILVKDNKGNIVQQYDIKSNFGGPNEWTMSISNIYGYTMANPFGGNTSLELKITDLKTKPNNPRVGDYNYTVSYIDNVAFGNPKYPKHTIHLTIKNNNDNLVMNSVLIVGLITNDKGQVVDILEQEGNEQTQIPAHQEKDFALSSISQTGRCVGPAGSGYTLQYWVSYFREDNQLMTKFFEMPIK